MPTVRVSSKPQWVHTGVRLVANKTYTLSASGEWLDASIRSGPDGYDSVNVFQRMTARLRRVPEERWFALIGAIDARRDTQFAIGRGCRYTPAVSGELTCFANDLVGFYWNNDGAVTLVIEEQ